MLTLNSGIIWTVINLIILVILLRIFLFKPIQRVIDKRKKMISDQIDNAKDREESAARKLEEAENYLKASGDAARKQADAILKEAQKKNEKMIAQAKAEADDILTSSRKQARKERDQFLEESRKEITGITLSAAKKLAGIYVNPEEEEHLFDQLLNKAGESNE